MIDKIDEVVTFVDQEVNDWGLVGDIEDAEIYDITVNEVEIDKLSAFKPVEEGDSLLTIGKLLVKATVEYSHPDWDTATYDSEDKVLIPFRDVSGKTEVEFAVDVSISITVDGEGEPEAIEMLNFRNDDF
jgi:hypothetical protein